MKKRRFAGIFVLLALTMMLFAASAEAATTKQKAMAAYKSFLAKNVIQRNARGAITNSTTAVSKFAIVYFNNDGIPDLLVENSGYYYEPFIYTYKSGKMVSIPSEDPVLQKMLTHYYKKKSCLMFRYESNGYPSSVNYSYFSLKSGKLTFRLEKRQKSGVTTYYGNTFNQISKGLFTKRRKAIVGTRSAAKITWRENSAANRKKYCK